MPATSPDSVTPGRSRKKKCDEQRPNCQRCLVIGWQCRWPTPTQLLDRRRVLGRKQSPNISAGDASGTDADQPAHEWQMSLASGMTAWRISSRDVKPMISKHFINSYLNLLILPDSDPRYSSSFVNEIGRHVPQNTGLQCAMLANAAAHLSSITKSVQMQELAIDYYLQALRYLQADLENESRVKTDNGLLISVMLLYVLGVSHSSSLSND
jgi:hypothetical protein